MATNAQVLPLSSNRPPRPVVTMGDVGTAWPVLAGTSVAATQMRSMIRRVAPHFRTAVLLGEEGCGGEQVARALHLLSPAKALPFVALDAAEAERRFARAETAPTPERAEGLIYLPEVARLSRAAQSGLLTMLHGASAWQHQPAQGGIGRGMVRVVAFAGRGLRPVVSAGSFHSELAGVLETLRLAIPSIRERADDVPQLLAQVVQSVAEELCQQPAELGDDLLEAAKRFEWPGNLNQMRAVMRRLLERGTGDTLHAEDLTEALEAVAQMQPVAAGPRLVRLEQVVQEHIRSVLIACNGNKLRAAEVLGISRSTLYRMLETTGFEPDWPMAG